MWCAPTPPIEKASTMSDPFKVKAEAKGSGGNYDLCPAGAHVAILIGIIDLGTQTDTYKGKQTESRRALFVWELPGEIKPDGNPFVLMKQFALYFKEGSKLREMIEGIRGKRFGDGEEYDILRLLDKPFQLTVNHTKSGDNSYHQIAGIGPLVKGTPVPKRYNDPFTFVCNGEQNPDSLAWLPWLYGQSVPDIIRESKEWKAHDRAPQPVPVGAAATADDEIPY